MNYVQHTVKCSFHAALIPDISHLLKILVPGSNFVVSSQDFYHEDGSDAYRLEKCNRFQREIQPCEYLLGAGEFVIQELSVGVKDLIWSFEQLSLGILPLKLLRNIGFAPVYNSIIKYQRSRPQTLTSICKNSTADTFNDEGILGEKLRSSRIEAGGGSGMGFQLLCDGVPVLTAGGGGGGLQFDERFSLRNPSTTDRNDGGVDDSNQSSDWSSVGGGGGCGSCTDYSSDSVEEHNYSRTDKSSRRRLLRPHSNYTTDRSNIRSQPLEHIMCGGSADEDSITRSQTTTQVASRIQSFTRYLSSTCEILEVIGGGGGGGGTAECALPLSFGYGFSFSYISKRNTAGVRSHATDNQSRGNIRDNKPRSMEDADQNDQFKYDIAGALLKDASMVCGGYTDWCCVSSQAGRRIRQCMSPDGSEVTVPAASNTVSCDAIVQASTRVSWLLNAGGCNSNSTTQSGTQRDESNAGGSEGKCSEMQNTSYPFVYDNDREDEDEGIRRRHSRDMISRMRVCLEGDQTLEESGDDGRTIDLSWATYSTALTPSELYSADNLYTKDAIFCIDSPHNLSNAFCGNGSLLGYCDGKGNIQKIQNSVLQWSDFYQGSAISALGSHITDTNPLNSTMTLTSQLERAEVSVNILVLVFIALIFLNIFTFFIKSFYPYNRVFEI